MAHLIDIERNVHKEQLFIFKVNISSEYGVKMSENVKIWVGKFLWINLIHWDKLVMLNTEVLPIWEDRKGEGCKDNDNADTKETEVVQPAEHDCEICDFVSNKESGVRIHMLKKHVTIQQLIALLVWHIVVSWQQQCHNA